MEQFKERFKSKPRHEFFFELLDEALISLNQLKIIEIPTTGIDAVNSQFNLNNKKPAFGSLRFDKDNKGRIFLQEFRPGSSAIKGSYFYSFHSDRPFWEIVGTLIARLNKKRKRHLENIVHNINRSSHNNTQYCLIMQGGLNKDFIKSLLEQGRVSFNIHNDYLKEEPVYSALSILSELSEDQIVETEVINDLELKKELVFNLARQGKSINEIACIIGKSKNGDYYTSPGKIRNGFPVQVWKDKVVPVNIANEISNVSDSLLNKKRLLVLEKITLSGLMGYLQNTGNYTFKAPSKNA